MKRQRLSHPPADASFSPGLRRLAWLNIVVQAAFTLAVAFTPTVVRAGSQGRVLVNKEQSLLQTRLYTLSEGETVTSVAAKYNMSPEALKKLNQFRSFARGVDALRGGDELDVPLGPLPEIKWAGMSDAWQQDTEDMQAQKMAGYASATGSFLTNNPNGDAAASLARGMASGAAGRELQTWLSSFGAARVQLDTDKNFSLKNSQLDLLVPLSEQKDRLVFTQGSLHRTDDRAQANLGAGVRHFYNTWMFGANIFLDYDLSRDYARGGAGLEYWRDFLKLGFNGYTHLSGWKDSPDLADYQERPASGWDIRAQGWLPALPQLGGKLTYEQYYGNEVALFGVNNRQKNPRAVTTGVSYTPVPLITLGAERRQGQSDKSDARMTVDMNYQLRVPWRHQVDPAAVAAMRSLASSRHDLVERNNNIFLEYRRKEVIRLTTANLVTGYGGEQKSLGVSVNSKYGLDRINWEASGLTAAGGKIVQSGADYAVVLPPYRSAKEAVNTYTISGVATDKKGNRSERSDTQVTVRAPVVSKQTSDFMPASSTLTADEKSTQELILTLRNDGGQAVDTDVKNISLKSNKLKSARVSELKRKAAGVYMVMVTSGMDDETVLLTPSVGGVTLSPSEVIMQRIAPAQANSAIATDAAAYVAGTDMTVTVTLKDAHGNALTGESGLLAADSVTVPNANLKGRWTDNGDGTYAATYTATTAGTGLKATLKLSDWGTGSISGTYAITLETEAPEAIFTETNPHTFVQTSEEGSFPTLGFEGASFTIVPKNGRPATDYNWGQSHNGTSIDVHDGKITMKGGVSALQTYIITGTPKDGMGKIVRYTFRLNRTYWVTKTATGRSTFAQATAKCDEVPNRRAFVPTASSLTDIRETGEATQIRSGSSSAGLWNQYGDLTRYESSGFAGQQAGMWTSTSEIGHGEGRQVRVRLVEGHLGGSPSGESMRGPLVCELR